MRPTATNMGSLESSTTLDVLTATASTRISNRRDGFVTARPAQQAADDRAQIRNTDHAAAVASPALFPSSAPWKREQPDPKSPAHYSTRNSHHNQKSSGVALRQSRQVGLLILVAQWTAPDIPKLGDSDSGQRHCYL